MLLLGVHVQPQTLASQCNTANKQQQRDGDNGFVHVYLQFNSVKVG